MTFDSKDYRGLCSCGKKHELVTEFCVVENGALFKLSDYMKAYSLSGYTVAVYDENTYQATSDRHPAVDAEVILPATDLHANEHGVDLLLERLPEKAQILIAIGSGTVHDITRYCAYSQHKEFVSCPTAASVDGFCSSVAAMTWHGCKKTLTAVAPKIVVADLEIVKNAPLRLAKSGFGDMIGKYVALSDWTFGKILKNEYYCQRIADLTMEATEASLKALEGILDGEESAYESLIFGLLLSGLAMQMIGNSRPASGAEHHISHLIEMEPCGLGVHSDALHGEKVGVGTLMVMKKYQELLYKDHLNFHDYEPYSLDLIASVFGNEKSNEIVKENEVDAAEGITAENVRMNFTKIAEVLQRLPSIEQLEDLFQKGGVKASLADIGVVEDLEEKLLKYAPMVRNRLTLLRLLSSGVIK